MTVIEILTTLGLCINIIGVIVIVLGVFEAVIQFVYVFFRELRLKKSHAVLPINAIRLSIGRSIVLGLEFMVAGDIIHTVARPDYYELGLLAILVIIRTVLSFFLTWEMATVSREDAHFC